MISSTLGHAISRRDGPQKVTGSARYTAEMEPAGAVYAVMVTSTIARGRELGIETQEAEAAPGVLAVLSRSNMPRLVPAPAVLANDGRGGTAGQQFLPMQDEAI